MNKPKAKTRLLKKLFISAKIFNDIFIDTEYLFYSPKFKNQLCYIIRAEKQNFLHLAGVDTNLNKIEFFNKCISKTLSEKEFDYYKFRSNGKRSYEISKKKNKAFSALIGLVGGQTERYIKEDFQKGSIKCALAYGDKIITIGFACGNTNAPQTLLLGPELETDLSIETLSMVLARKKGDKYFSKEVFCKDVDYKDLPNDIKNLIHRDLLDSKITTNKNLSVNKTSRN